MYTKILVEQDVQNGRKLLEALQDRLPLLAAFWLNAEDASEWNLVLVSPLVSAGKARLAYRMIRQVLAESGVPIPMDNISVLSPVDSRYKEVRRASQGIPSGLTVAQNFGMGAFAGDAYIYIMN
jgi:hypothetical protein